MSWAEVTKINSDLTKPLNEISILKYASIVKSIQRGVYAAPAATRAQIDINIAAINPGKSTVALFGVYDYDGTRAVFVLPIVSSLTSVLLTLKQSSYLPGSGQATFVSWEIVEYY